MSEAFDEPAGRTRMSWMRTLLGVVAVTMLVERGLVVRAAPAGWLAVAAAPALAFAALVAMRARRLAGTDPAPMGRGLLVAAALTVIALAGIGVTAWRP
ncbi:MAG: hypothetical protein ACYC0W_08425 [Candidatus Nanopelagicales bacterium]